MAFTDKTLSCVECGASFTFTAKEQEFYQQRGFVNEPKRCSGCRAARKGRMGGGGGGGHRGHGGGGRGGRTTYTATCAACGREAQLPFQPRGDKPVYCSDCFRNR